MAESETYRCPTWLPRDPLVPHAERIRCGVTRPHAEHEHQFPDEVRGLYTKYEVARLNDPDGKHDSCWFFVLDPQHDPIARAALAAYADEADRRGFSVLANGLRRRLAPASELSA